VRKARFGKNTRDETDGQALQGHAVTRKKNVGAETVAKIGKSIPSERREKKAHSSKKSSQAGSGARARKPRPIY